MVYCSCMLMSVATQIIRPCFCIKAQSNTRATLGQHWGQHQGNTRATLEATLGATLRQHWGQHWGQHWRQHWGQRWGHLRKLWPIRLRLRASCREGGAGAALPRVMRTRLAASVQVASVALLAITRSAGMERKRNFDSALGGAPAKQLTAEKNSAACATYNSNAQQEIALQRDLAKEDFKKLRQQLACTADCVFGGPPCQGFLKRAR